LNLAAALPASSSELLRQIERIAGIGAWQIDLATYELAWSEQMFRLHGVARDSFRPTLEAARALLAPASRAAFDAAVSVAIEAGQPWDLELELATAQGARWVRWLGEAQERDGRRVRLAGTMQDVTAERAAREQLAARVVEANKLATVAQNTRNVVIITDAHDRIEWVNQSFTRITGYTLCDARGKRPRDLLNRSDTEDSAAYRAAAARWRTGEAINDVPLKLYRKDGTPYWASVEIRPVRDERGAVAHFVHIQDDITAQRLAEEERQRLAQHLQLANEAAGIGLVLRDLRTDEALWDAMTFRVYGFAPADKAPPREEVMARIHPDDRARFDRYWRDLLASGAERHEIEFRVMHPDGRTVHVYARGRVERDDEGRPVRVIGAVIDLTALRLAERRAREAVEWLELASGATGIGFYHRDVDQPVGVWDRQMRAVYGLRDDEPVPDSAALERMVVPEDHARYVAAREQSDRTGAALETDYRIRRRDGQVRWIRWRRVVLPASAERTARIVGAVVDVTDQKQIEQQHRQILERLQLAVEVGGIGLWERNLVTGAAHWDATLFSLYGLHAAHGTPDRATAVRMVHPDDRPTVESAWTRMQQVRHAVEFEYRVVRPDGSIVYLNTRGLALRDAAGKPERILGATIDVTARQMAQRQLREYDEWLRLAGAATGIGFFQIAADGSYRRIDRQVRAMFGFDPEAATPTREQFENAVAHEDRAILHQVRERELATDAPIEAEYRVRLPSGSLRHIFTRRVRRCDDNGRPLYVIGTAVDVTQNRRAQQALQTAHERLRLATQTARIGIWQRDLASGELTWDARMREIYRVAADWRPTPEGWLDRTHPDDRARLAQRFGGATETCDQGRDEYRIVLPDGSIRHVVESFTVRRDEFGAPAQMLGTNLDITEVRSAQQERDLLYERIQLAAESIGLGVWDWDLVAETSVWNDQMYALFGRTRAQFDRRRWSDFVHPDDAARARAEIAHALDATGRCDFEFRVVLPDGEVRWIGCRGRVQRDAVGTPVRMLGVNWDLTEKHAAEAARRDKETAERASRAKSEFLSRMSHELRTPLNAILGFAQVLELDQRDPLSAVQADRVGRVQKAGWHLLTLINEVLELSRIEAGALPLALAPVPLAGAVGESIELIAPTAAARGIAVELHLDRDAPALVRADPTRLRQVLLNLLSNAVKYNRDGGRVDVLIGGAGADATLRVRDTGHGMSEDQLAHLFEPFNRLGASDAIEGTGIGLTITRRLVELMGGQIEAASRLGDGTEFSLRLPAAVEAPAPVDCRRAATREMATVATVLYVEDNEPNRELVREILTLRPGIRLLEAATGEQGLRVAAATPLDFALIDLRLPDMDGIELLQRLRATEAADLPCAVLSANALPADRERALRAGFIDYWTKPIVAAEFLQAIDRTLERLAARARI
jgi:hypothetical protein